MQEDLTTINKERANTACTRLVGLAAFSGSFLGSSQFRQSGVVSSRPPAGNAHRWAWQTNLVRGVSILDASGFAGLLIYWTVLSL